MFGRRKKRVKKQEDEMRVSGPRNKVQWYKSRNQLIIAMSAGMLLKCSALQYGHFNLYFFMLSSVTENMAGIFDSGNAGSSRSGHVPSRQKWFETCRV
jgi:hypothetical protein